MNAHHGLQDILFSRETEASFHPGGLHKRLASSRSMVRRLQKETSLEGHNGCVNTISWNQEGDLIISGSDDHKLLIWDPFQRTLLKSLETGHQANIFSAHFLTNSGNKKIISSDASGEVRFYNLERSSTFLPPSSSSSSPFSFSSSFSRGLPFNCNNDAITFEVAPDPENPNVFFACSQEGAVRQYDLRIKESCRCQNCRDDVIIDLSLPASSSSSSFATSSQQIGIASMTFHPLNPALFSLGCWDSSIRSFDRRMLPTGGSQSAASPFYALTPSFLRSTRPRRIFRDDFMFKITSLRYNHDGTELLVSYSNDQVYLIRPNSPPDAPHYVHRASDGPQNRHSTRVSTRGGWADTGPDAGINEEGVNPTMARLSQLFQRFIDVQMNDPAQEEENKEPSSPPKPINESPTDKDIIMCYKGHRNSHTMIKEAGFFGANSEFVMSGSDDGRIFFWDKKSGEIINYVIGDKHVVNCLQPHPTIPLLASSGIDYDVKLWTPTRDEPNPMEDLDSVLSRNRSFLAQGEPLVIPASLLFQFLANSAGS